MAPNRTRQPPRQRKPARSPATRHRLSQAAVRDTAEAEERLSSLAQPAEPGDARGRLRALSRAHRRCSAALEAEQRRGFTLLDAVDVCTAFLLDAGARSVALPALCPHTRAGVRCVAALHRLKLVGAASDDGRVYRLVKCREAPGVEPAGAVERALARLLAADTGTALARAAACGRALEQAGLAPLAKVKVVDTAVVAAPVLLPRLQPARWFLSRD